MRKAKANGHAAPPDAADCNQENPVALIAKDSHKWDEDGLCTNRKLVRSAGQGDRTILSRMRQIHGSFATEQDSNRL